MNNKSPQELLNNLITLRTDGKIDEALACYEPTAMIVAQPGQVMTGLEAVRAVLEFFAAGSVTFDVVDRQFFEADGVALHLSQWELRGKGQDGATVDATGRSADVARRQADGTWLLAIDNPWGADLDG